jgi:L-threonylcarbamoyladenylate synthase
MERFQADRNAAPHAELLRAVARVLERNGVVAFPTETLYALGVHPGKTAAVDRLFRIKKRSESHRLPFVAGDVNQVRRYVRLEGPLAEALAERFWPGPLTLVVPLIAAHLLAPGDWGETLAVRIPACPLARGLALHLGMPLPATSANVTGEAPASDPEDLSQALRESIDLLVDAGPLPPSLPSTVVDLTGRAPQILRAGAIAEAALEPFLGHTGQRPSGAD